MAKLAAPFANHPLVTDVRQAGMIVAIELQPEPGGTEDGNAVEIANRRGPAMYRTALERGLLLRPLGEDRKSVVAGKSASVGVDPGGGRYSNKKKKKKHS